MKRTRDNSYNTNTALKHSTKPLDLKGMRFIWHNYIFMHFCVLEGRKYAHPVVWITFSLITALFTSVNKEVKSLVAEYGFKTFYLQAPASLLMNMFILLIFSCRGLSHKSEESQALIKRQESSLKNGWQWLRTIYFEETPQNSEISLEVSQPKYKLIKMRIVYTLILIAINILSFWFSVLSVKYAVSVELNLGVVSWFSALKPAICGILFYIVFYIPLNRYDALGIWVIIVSIMLLSISGHPQTSNNGKYIVWIT